MWFKDLYSIPVCYHLFLSTNISLKCSGPGPSKAFIFFFFKVCFLTEEMGGILHSFTLRASSGTGHYCWLTPSLEAWPHVEPNQSSFLSRFWLSFFISQHSNWKIIHQLGHTCSRVRRRLVFVLIFKLGTQRCFVDNFFNDLFFNCTEFESKWT